MCRAFIDNWKRQQFIEQQKTELKEFQDRAERLSKKLRGTNQ
jgi:hypothetical protein